MRHLEVQVLAFGSVSLVKMGLDPAGSRLLLSWSHRARSSHRLEDSAT